MTPLVQLLHERWTMEDRNINGLMLEEEGDQSVYEVKWRELDAVYSWNGFLIVLRRDCV